MENLSPRLAQRRVLIDALMVCLERSKVCQVIEPRTIRFVLDSARGVLATDGEFRLDPVWKILCQQPELSARDAAAPLLVFKSYQELLGVRVALPEELALIPEEEQQVLRGQIDLSRADFERALGHVKDRPVEREALPDEDTGVRQRPTGPEMPAAPTYSDKFSTVGQSKTAGAKSKTLAVVLGVLALVAVGIGVLLTLPTTPGTFDLSRVSGMLMDTEGRRIDASLTARIVDPKWEGMKPEDQRKLAEDIFELLIPRGIQAMTLIDRSGYVRVQAVDVGGNRRVHVH